MKPLTARQQEILDYIRSRQAEAGDTPSFREIGDHFGFKSPNAVRDHLRALARKGALEKAPGLARSLKLTTPLARLKAATVDIPLYGSIPAGFADQRDAEPAGCITVDIQTLDIKPSARTFALQVRGDSMTGKHILEGDIVICQHGREPKRGDVVAALIDNESTLKTFTIRRGKPCLKAENPRFPDLIPAADLVIQGVVTAIIRRLG